MNHQLFFSAAYALISFTNLFALISSASVLEFGSSDVNSFTSLFVLISFASGLEFGSSNVNSFTKRPYERNDILARFSGSKIINLRRQFRVRDIFSRLQLTTKVFARFAVFSFCI